MVHFELQERCRDFPKDVLPCYEEETLRSEMRHIVYLPFMNGTYGQDALDVGVLTPGSQSFRVASGVFVVHRADDAHPFSEIVIETALDAGFALATGDVVSVCDGGEPCLPCIDPATSRWDSELQACECFPDARQTGDGLFSAQVFLRPGVEPAIGFALTRFAQRVHCEQCAEYEVAVDGIDTDGNFQRKCECAPTFGRSTAVFELALGLPSCRCEKGHAPVGSVRAGDAECVMCSGNTFKLQVGNDPCTPCPDGEVSRPDSDGQDCACPDGRGFVLDPNNDQLATWLSSSRSPRCLCEPGHSYNATAHQCDRCAYDSFNAARGRLACTLCAATFVATADRTACECPPHSDPVLDPTTGLPSSCPCQAGFRKAADNRRCEPCPANTFRQSASDPEICVDCPDLSQSGPGAAACSCMPGTVSSATPAIAGGSLCQCDALHVLRFAEDPVLLLPGDVPAPAEAARVAVTSVAHTLYGPGRTFSFAAYDAQELMLGVTVDAATGYVDVDIYLYRPATERVLLSVRLYSLGPSVAWGHLLHVADQTATGARALASTSRTDWRAGDVLAVAAQTPYNQYCLPCRSASQCAACTASSQYFGPDADPVCSAPQPVGALPCDEWAPDDGAGVCVPCPLLEVGALDPAAGSATDGCVCAAGHEADPLWVAGSTTTLRCRACPAGSFKPSAGDVGCTPCAFGAVAEPGSTECKECGTDEAAPRDSATCQPCEAHSGPLPGNRTYCVCDAGYFRDASSGSCVLCADDFAKAAPGDDGCLPCPPLQSNYPADQRATCSCDAGAESNGTACNLCAEDFFKDAPGNSACTPCGTGLGTVLPGATSASACVCGRGWYNRSGTCHMCPPNTFNDQAGRFNVESCRACPFRTFQPASGQKRCAPSQVAWPFNTLQHYLVGLRVTASLSCAQLMEVVDGIALSASEVCWGDGNGAATVVAANPALDGQQRSAPAIFGAICGDGVVFPGGLEECDDGNSLALDGCSDCAIDNGFRCDYRNSGHYSTTVSVPSSCCRVDGRATCERCFERPSPYPGVVFDGLSCELVDVDECADSSLSTCWQTGAVCVNLDARAGPEALRYECRCDDVAALCFHLQQFDAAREFIVQTVVMVEEAESAASVTDRLRNSAMIALHRLHHNTSLDTNVLTINTLNATKISATNLFFVYETTTLVNNSNVTMIAASLIVATWADMQNVVFEDWIVSA